MALITPEIAYLPYYVAYNATSNVMALIHLFTHPDFRNLKTVVDNMMQEKCKKGIGLNKKKADIITEQEKFVWENGYLVFNSRFLHLFLCSIYLKPLQLLMFVFCYIMPFVDYVKY